MRDEAGEDIIRGFVRLPWRRPERGPRHVIESRTEVSQGTFPPLRAERLPGPVSLATALTRAAARLRDVPDHGDLVQLSASVEPLDLLDWLGAQTVRPAHYWHSRNGRAAVAAVGTSVCLDGADFDVLGDWAGGLSADADPRLFLTARFDLRRPAAPEWQPFGAVRALAPTVELRRSDEEVTLVVTGSARTAGLVAGLAEPRPFSGSPPPLLDLVDPGHRERWERSVRAVLGRILEHQVEKAVLSRTVRASSPTPLQMVRLLRRLRRNHANTFLFGTDLGGGRAFLGASPELLYRRRGRVIESEALAGTRPRGTDDIEDHRLAQELLDSAKEGREHGHVLEHLRDRLAPLCERFEEGGQPLVRRLSNVQHLCTPVRGTLRAPVTDADLLAGLHPTPAVCGLPSDEARALIADEEGHDRGLYAGVVGVVGRHEVECAVGIRSGRIDDRSLILHTGAGIVRGSDPGLEWEETTNKLRAFGSLVAP